MANGVGQVADVRTMKLNLLADVAQFGRGLMDAEKDVKGFNNKIGGYSKKMAKAFLGVAAAAGAMAIAIGIDAVKAVAEDEVSQKKFRETLKDTAGVIDDDVIKSIDGWIEKMQFATGYSDSQLRDSLGRLTRSTGNVAEAQGLTNLAMDIARGTGKDLESVSLALGKAYDGNEGALKRLGIPLDDAILKSGDFKDITDELSRLFGGQASEYADTYQGKLDIVNQRLGELKESAGAPLVGVLGTLLEKVNDVAKGFAGEDPQSLSNRARELAGNFEGDGSYSLGYSLRAVADAFGRLFDEIASPDASTGVSTLDKLASAMETFAKAIDLVAKAYDGYFKVYDKVPDFLKTAMNPIARLGQYIDLATGSRAAGGSVMSGGAYRVGEFGPETFVPSGSGSIRPDSGGQGVTIIMNGVIDGESARRSIERLLQDSARRTGAINLVGATL